MSRRYPPGPINFNAWIGLTWRHAFRLWHDPLDFIDDMARYGDIVFYRFFWYEGFQLNHPDVVREAFLTKAKNFEKQTRQMNLLRSITGDGLLNAEGELWRRQRRIIGPAFAAEQGRHLAMVAIDETQKMLDRWDGLGEIRVHDEFLHLLTASISRAMFGEDLGNRTPELADAMTSISEGVMDEFLNPFMLPDWFPTPGIQRKVQGRQLLNDFVAETIARRRASGKLGRDLLGVLLTAVDNEGDGKGMSDKQAHAEALTIFFAGHHTAAASLAWTAYLLAQNPEIDRRLATAIAEHTPGHGAARGEAIPYVEWTMKESMRIYPPAWSLFGREAVQDCELGGYPVPAGSWIFCYPWVLHHDERFFPDPWRFEPERFTPERAEQIPIGSFIPFGVGGHACSGMRMAMSMLTTVLPLVVQRYSFRLSPEQGPVQLDPLVSLRPRGDIRLTIHRRVPSKQLQLQEAAAV